jgi:hypothetical protein
MIRLNWRSAIKPKLIADRRLREANYGEFTKLPATNLKTT